MPTHMLYHMLNYDISTHKIAIDFCKWYTICLKPFLYLNTVLVRLSFSLQTPYWIIFLDTPQKIV